MTTVAMIFFGGVKPVQEPVYGSRPGNHKARSPSSALLPFLFWGRVPPYSNLSTGGPRRRLFKPLGLSFLSPKITVFLLISLQTNPKKVPLKALTHKCCLPHVATKGWPNPLAERLDCWVPSPSKQQIRTCMTVRSFD